MMNKTEKAELERLRAELAEAKALHFTDRLLPDLMPPPLGESGLTVGWTFNSYSGRVDAACSSSVSHGIGLTDRTTTQQAIRLYSTKLLAYRGLRAVLERDYARQLAKIDRKIEELQR